MKQRHQTSPAFRPSIGANLHLKWRESRATLCGTLLLLMSIAGAAQVASTRDSAPAPEKVALTAEKLLSDYSSWVPLPSVRWVPNSKQLIFSIEDRSQVGTDSKIWIEIVDLGSGKRQRLVEGENPYPSPDGSRIAYVAGEKGNAQLWVISPQGENPRPLTQVPRGLGASSYYRNFSWSPDSRRIAYAFRPVPPTKEVRQTDQKLSSVVVIGEEGDIPPDSEIWIVDVDTGSHRKVTAGPYVVRDLSWFPDGQTLLLTVVVGGFEYRKDDMFGEVRSVSVETGEVRTLVKDGGVQSLRASLSPNRKQVAFTYDPANVVYPYHWHIATVAAEGGPIQQLTKNVFITSGPFWSPDGNRIYFTRQDGVFRQICFVTTRGELNQLTRAPRNALSVTVSPNGDHLAWTSQDAEGRAEIRVARTDGAEERVLVDLAPEVKTLALGEVEEIRWKSRDGLEIVGLLIKPVGYEPGKKYPLLVDLHGGPVGGVYLRGSIVMTSPLEWHLWATRGFVVLVPDYRSSVIYGWDQVVKARERQDANDRDFDDIMSGVDHVIKLGMVDKDKLAVSGHSYGAVLTNWIITHTDRFKVAVSKEGVAEMFFAYGTGLRVGGNSIFEWLYKGKPWEVPENYSKNSATEYVKAVKTPTLFVSGDTQTIPLYHNEFLFTALSKQGVDTQFVVYKGEGHVIQRPENMRELLMRVLEWVDSHLR